MALKQVGRDGKIEGVLESCVGRDAGRTDGKSRVVE